MRPVPSRALEDGLAIAVRLTARGGRDLLERVRVRADGRAVPAARVRAAPQKGEANHALRRLPGEALALPLPLGAPTVRAGHKARLKTIHAAGEAGTLARRLDAITQSPQGTPCPRP